VWCVRASFSRVRDRLSVSVLAHARALLFGVVFVCRSRTREALSKHTAAMASADLEENDFKVKEEELNASLRQLRAERQRNADLLLQLDRKQRDLGRFANHDPSQPRKPIHPL
jgi:hypothetical protein